MVSIVNKKNVMTLFSGPNCLYGHACRIVIQEKDVECESEVVDPEGDAEGIAELNPYGETPILVDRDLVLYGAAVISEYLDERLPHPPLMPIDPVGRARARLMILRLQRDWLDEFNDIAIREAKPTNDAKKRLWEGLTAVSPIFGNQHHMLGSEFSLVDCFMAPLLWRLPSFGVKLPRQARPVLDYAERLFARPAFVSSLTEEEQQQR